MVASLPHRAVIALGANLGPREETLAAALAALATTDVQIVGVSSWIECPAIGGPAAQPAFLNGAALLATACSARELHDRLLKTETQLGRKRDTTWGPRTIDLDLLLFDDATIDSPALTIPHPRLAVRSFALRPASEVAPAMRHPWLDCDLAALWHRWQHGDDAIAIVADQRDTDWIVHALQQRWPVLAVQQVLVPGARTVVSPSRAAVDAAPRLSFCVDRSQALRGVPTLMVDPQQPETSKRDILAAVADLWPNLG